jgi:3-isopropylmalate/(R)-2-methylmalate dehydratase small subunit
MAAFTTLVSRVVVLPASDIDTDQIIPARFLKVTDKAGLGDKLFHDWRYRDDGTPDPGFPLARPGAAGARILLAGANFGCGSSREHAPWALLDWGFRAVIAPSFADIFRNNALKNGLLPVALESSAHAALLALVSHAPAPEVTPEVTIDLAAQKVTWPGGEATFAIDAFAQRCLLEGMDELSYLLSLNERIDAYEAQQEPEAGSIP